MGRKHILFVGVVIISAAVTAQAALPEGPRVFIDTTYSLPTGGTTHTVNSGDDLQAVINAANQGDVIVLQAGATFSGNYTLPNKSGSGWIYIQSSALGSLPGPGTRVNWDNANQMPKIISPDTSPAIQTDFGAHHYRFVGIEIGTSWSSQAATHGNVILIGYNLAGQAATSLSQLPHDITFDRCFIHGTITGNVRRGIMFNLISGAVIDSTISEIHEVGADSQAIAAVNGPGPYKLVNNFLSGSTENVLFGGDDPKIADLVPSDIEIRGNYIYKPLSWKVGHPSFGGIHWAVKNLLEFKNAQRVIVDGNILENNWADAQSGTALLFTPRNQDGGCNWCVVQDIAYTHNILKHTGGAVNFLSIDYLHPSLQTQRILLQNNVFEDITSSSWGGNGTVFQINNQAQAGMADLIIDHNTGFGDVKIANTGDYMVANTTGFIFRNNILSRGVYGFFGSATAEGDATLNTFYVNPVFTKNALPESPSWVYPAHPDNYFPADLDAVGFINYWGGDYRLSASSPYRNAGTDGKDLGADMNELSAATGCTISGNCNGAPPYIPPVTGSTCDLDASGLTNVTDVQLAVNQAMGAASCSSGDINTDGQCNVIDVQRVVVATLGGVCFTQ